MNQYIRFCRGGMFLVILAIFILPFRSFSSDSEKFVVKKPLVVMAGVETQLTIVPAIDTLTDVNIVVNQVPYRISKVDGEFKWPVKVFEKTEYNIQCSLGESQITISPIPLWFSIIPPLIAILAALLFKEVFVALLLGLLFGTVAIYYFHGNNVLISIGLGFFAIITDYILPSLNESSHLSIILFSMLIGGMVQIITKNGGMGGIVFYLSKFAKTKKSGQFITWLLGVAIFFDDYANTLVVGTTMKPVTDKLKISRAKLAYIVDSTAAPVASIALITTWIGAQLSYIQEGIDNLQMGESAYMVFLHSIPYAFYPFFTLIFILILIYTGRDFGPMLKAQEKLQHSFLLNNLDNTDSNQATNQPQMQRGRALNALIPVFIVVFGTIGGLVITGLEKSSWSHELSFARNISRVIGSSDSFKALLWSSFAGTFVAIALSVAQRILSIKESMESMIEGFKLMLPAILILTLAWSLAALTQNLQTAQFISKSLIDFQVSPFLLPGITFVLAALIAFSTGSSWGTMAILYPLILPATWLLSKNAGLDYEQSLSLFHNVVSVVLAGSVFGDHCSPISDTTIMSSLSSQCNHIEHVNTQLPYAVIVGLLSLIFGTIPVAFGFPGVLSFFMGILAMFIIIRYFGRKVPD